MGRELSRDGDPSSQGMGKGCSSWVQPSHGFLRGHFHRPLVQLPTRSRITPSASLGHSGFVQPNLESQGVDPRERSCFLSDMLIKKMQVGMKIQGGFCIRKTVLGSILLYLAWGGPFCHLLIPVQAWLLGPL